MGVVIEPLVLKYVSDYDIDNLKIDLPNIKFKTRDDKMTGLTDMIFETKEDLEKVKELLKTYRYH